MVLVWMSQSASAQSTEIFCAMFDVKNNGDYLFQATENLLNGASRRSMEEPASVGISAVKGALARRLSNDFNGKTIRWSGAKTLAPISCSGYRVIVVTVDLSTVKPVEIERIAPEPNDVLIEGAIIRQQSGLATREDLAALRDFYARNGNLLLAKKMAEEILNVK
jgi:hypothetical protein